MEKTYNVPVISADIPGEPIEDIVDTAEVSEPGSASTTWIAEWDFNDVANIGLDATGNGHDATIGEGSVSSADGIATFDGRSGFQVKLANDIRINDFVT